MKRYNLTLKSNTNKLSEYDNLTQPQVNKIISQLSLLRESAPITLGSIPLTIEVTRTL